jgi:two-component system chemotaxis response regulator CheB
VTVVVVDDSPVQRRFLRLAAEADGDVDVVGEARNGKEAVALVERLRPSVVLMDLDLPVMSGIEAIERIMASSPTPILVCSGFVEGAARGNALEALAAGAVDVLAKPGPADATDLDQYADGLRKRLRVASRVRVITHPRGRLRTPEQEAAPRRPLTGTASRRPLHVPAQGQQQGPGPDQASTSVTLLAIGASTGGPQALLTVLSTLPADLTQAVLVVQHMAEGFIPGLAAWLDGLVALPVLVGQSGRRLAAGTVTIAPSGGNLLVQDDRLRTVCVPPEPGSSTCPASTPPSPASRPRWGRPPSASCSPAWGATAPRAQAHARPRLGDPRPGRGHQRRLRHAGGRRRARRRRAPAAHRAGRDRRCCASSAARAVVEPA